VLKRNRQNRCSIGRWNFIVDKKENICRHLAKFKAEKQTNKQTTAATTKKKKKKKRLAMARLGKQRGRRVESRDSKRQNGREENSEQQVIRKRRSWGRGSWSLS